MAAAALVATLFGVLQARVHWTARDRIFAGPESVPYRPVAVVFGASVYGKRLSDTLARRVDTAVELYVAGRVSRILVSGDNSSSNYNESDAMRRYVLARGVPEEHVVSDFAGFSTYETLYRARSLFGVTRPVLVTQRYHLPRAIYTARKLGLDAVGVAAPSSGRLSGSDGLMRLRESLAAVKAFIQSEITRPEPTYLGPVEADLESPSTGPSTADSAEGAEPRDVGGTPSTAPGSARADPPWTPSAGTDDPAGGEGGRSGPRRPRSENASP